MEVPGGELTYSATPVLEMAVLARDPDLAQMVVSRINDAPPAAQNRNHHLARLLIAVLTGVGETQIHREKVKSGHPEIAAYEQMLGAVIDRDPAALLSGAQAYLKWHRRAAEKGSLKMETDGLVALPVLVCLTLGRRCGLDVTVEDEYVPMVAVE